MHERGKQEDHVPALVHDGGVAVTAAHFARQFVLDGFIGRIVPFEVVVAICKVDVCLVEDGGPLEGCGMLRLTSRAVTKFTIQRLPPTQLILHFSTMAIRLVFDVKVVVLLVHAVGRALLPLRDTRRRLAAGLVLIHSCCGAERRWDCAKEGMEVGRK